MPVARARAVRFAPHGVTAVIAACTLHARRRMHDSPSERRRLLDKLLRELVRCEARARRVPALADSPPIAALRDVAAHADAMQARLQQALDGHGIAVRAHGWHARATPLRARVVERLFSPRGPLDAERAFRTALLDLRHAIDVVAIAAKLSREDRVFAVVRWCDDWLEARRPLVARVEAQLSWFAERERTQPPAPPAAPAAPPAPPAEAIEPSRAGSGTRATVARGSHDPDPGTPGARSNDQQQT
jgi:hypothetical protein